MTEVVWMQTVSPHMMARRSGKIGIVCGTDSYLARPFLAATVVSPLLIILLQSMLDKSMQKVNMPGLWEPVK